MWLVNSNNTYKIQPNVFGSQQINFLGSKEWTWISDINFYTQSNSEAISITSDYLQNIKATAGNTAGIWTIKCPALKTIELDGQETMYGETLLELNITSTSDLPINNGQFMYVGHNNNSSYFSAGITLPRFRNAQNKNFIYVEWNTTLSTSQLKSSEDADIYIITMKMVIRL